MSESCHNHEHCGSTPCRAISGFSPSVWRFGEVGSCLDTAIMLAGRGWLAPWESVQAVSQTAGRGQLRRHWHSPVGNVYAALRLPLDPPFDGTAAAPAVGLLLAEALCAEGFPVKLKWPNDLVLHAAGATPRKLAGILLEERGGVLLAGIGVNVRWSPPAEMMRASAALEAVCLGDWLAGKPYALPTAEALWQTLVNRIHSAYVNCHSFTKEWKNRAESLLLWRGENVELCDEDHIVRGCLTGLALSGGLCLNINGRLEELFCGSLRLNSNAGKE